MTVPPDDNGERGRDDTDRPLDFDPYRFGRPEHPVPPEYAPPGYVPPPAATPPPASRLPPPQGAPYGYGQYGPSPQQPYRYPPPGTPPYRAPSAGNTKATIALVLGIVAIACCWLSVFDLVLIVPAIVLGVLGRADAARNPQLGGRRSATSGLICALVAIVLVVAVTAYGYSRLRPCLDRYQLNSQPYNQCVSHRLFGS